MITTLIQDKQPPRLPNKCTVYRVDFFTTILFFRTYSSLNPIFVCQLGSLSIHICRLTASSNLAAFPQLLIWLVGPTALIRTWTRTGAPAVPPSKSTHIHDRTHRGIIHNHPPMNLRKTEQTIPPGDVLLSR